MSDLQGKTPEEVWEMLGERIKIDFSSQIEEYLHIDVVQIGLEGN